MISDPADVDRGLLDRLNAINNTLTTQWNRLQSIRNTVDDTGAQADRARNRVRDAESLIDRARQELDKANEAVRKVVRERRRRHRRSGGDSERDAMTELISSAGHQTAQWHRRPEQHDAAGRGGENAGGEVRADAELEGRRRTTFVFLWKLIPPSIIRNKINR